jgi:hypothetical protein
MTDSAHIQGAAVTATRAALEVIDRLEGCPAGRLARRAEARPSIQIDVAPGATEDFSLEGLDRVHFVTQTP